MHARLERINAVGRCKMEILGLQGAEEAFDHRVVKAVALAAHALLDSMAREHRSAGLHLVVPTLVRVHDQFCGAPCPRKRCLERAGNQLEDRTPCHAVRDDLAVVQVHAGRQVELVVIHLELGDVGHPLLIWRGRAEVALQNVGHVRIAHARYMPGALLRPNQCAQSHLLHQALHALVVDRFGHRIAQHGRDPPVAVAAFVLVIDSADPGFHGALLVGALACAALVVERAACQSRYLQQVRQFMVMPQPGNQTRFVGAAYLFDRIKACNFFRYATSARSRSFSSRRVCAASVATMFDGAAQRRSGFILGRSSFSLSKACRRP